MKFLIIFTLLCVQFSQVVPGGPGQTDPSNSLSCPSYEDFDAEFQQILSVITELSPENQARIDWPWWWEQIEKIIEKIKEWIEQQTREEIEKLLRELKKLYEKVKNLPEWCKEYIPWLSKLIAIIDFIEKYLDALDIVN